jgi:hypothetical protein
MPPKRHRIASSTEYSISLHLPVQFIKEPKGGNRNSRVASHCRPCKCSQQRLFAVPSRESISDDVGSARTKFDPEIIPKQFAYPMMLRNCR